MSKLSRFVVAEGGPIGPFFAAAVAGEPVPEGIDESAVRRAFGGTLAPDLDFEVDRMARYDGHWDAIVLCMDRARTRCRRRSWISSVI